MEALTVTITVWLIVQGVLTGTIFGIVIKREGVSVLANMIWGIIGSLLTGYIAVVLGFGDGLLFAFMGTLAVLFLVNAFHFHHVEDISGHVNRGIWISRSQDVRRTQL